ncbi:uncharacterized protein LOC143364351 isoform X2 [Halictus rubicundus]|uniref:uncharacterized protein LOC143364351 isoform X2 n=1 Tax=Halictus rubicundus TaxID=77578 RepID=UPI004036BCA8
MINVNANRTKSRKRVRNSDGWAGNVAKRLRNSGAEYVNRNNNIVPAKKFENKDCGCQKKCTDKVDGETRKNHFYNFWKIGSFNTQNAYLCGLIHSVPIKRRRPRDESRCMKSSSNVYCLPNIGDSTSVVCKKYFLQTFGVSEGRVNRAIIKHAEGETVGNDNRAPRKDRCKKCDEYKIKLDAVSSDQEVIKKLEEEDELHLRKAEAARNSMKEDIKNAKCSNNIYVRSIDLQKALPFPILTVSDAYYKRNMYCYNLGIHDLRENKGYFYVWDETLASRGSQEIASCLVKHIKSVAGYKDKIIIYSDSCTGQNRNIKIALSLLKLVQSDDIAAKIIEQKFLISGHSFLPNDSDFGCVESAARHTSIYIHEDWYRCMKTARHSNKFVVYEMKRNEFFSTKQLERSITKRKKNTLRQTVNWFTIQWLHYERGKQFDIFYKTTISVDVKYEILNIQRARCGRPLQLKNITQENLYPSVRPVSEAKKKDMIDLLKFIPPVHHAFFQALKTSTIEETGEESSNE